MTPAVLITLIIVIGVILLLLIGGTLDNQQKIRLARVEAEQKQAMIERGLPIYEIERLLRASSSPASPSLDAVIMQLSHALVSMVNAEASEENIAALVEAFALNPTRFGSDMLRYAAAPSHPPSRVSIALASAIKSMVADDNDAGDIAAFLNAFRLAPGAVLPGVHRDPSDRAANHDDDAALQRAKSGWPEIV